MENEYSIRLLKKKHGDMLIKWPTINADYLTPNRGYIYPSNIVIKDNKIISWGIRTTHYTMKEWLELKKHEVLNG